jgi:hypothetical protein
MRAASDIAAEMDEGLKALFQAGLELSLQMQADALAADKPQERARLALAFHRLSRSVRQTAALRMRLAREAERSVHEARTGALQLEEARRKRRKAHLKGAISALVWTEYEPQDAEAEALLERLDGVLDAQAETEDFLETEPQAQIEALRQAIGFEPSAPPAPPPFTGVQTGEEDREAVEGASPEHRRSSA